MKLASIFLKALVVLTLVSAISLLGACIIAYYPIRSLPILDVFGILVPLLVFINFLFFLLWILFKRWYALISLMALVVGFLNFGSIYQYHYLKKNIEEGDLSILSYNVQGFSSFREAEITDFADSEVYNFIDRTGPDIVCFQEYGRGMTRSFKQYPFRYQTPFRSNKTAQAIFSKYPIIDSGSLNFPNTNNNAIFADVAYGKDTIRIYNVHLQSYWIYSFRSIVKKNSGKDFLKRLHQTAAKHREQALMLETHRKASNLPAIYVGDFNQPQFSPSFKLLSTDMKDSFREAGKGWGTTFKRNYIKARIDFILADDQSFEILDHQNFNLDKSDHLPIMARLKLLSHE